MALLDTDTDFIDDDMVWYAKCNVCGKRKHGMVVKLWYAMVWFSIACYGMVFYGMLWYGFLWYAMVWFAKAWYCWWHGWCCLTLTGGSQGQAKDNRASFLVLCFHMLR